MNELRTVTYDQQLSVEAYQFEGIKQKFPNHFHQFYVIGFIEKGKRFLSCKNKEYVIAPNDLLLINPYDSHYCEQIDNTLLDYRSLHIEPAVMKTLCYWITEKEQLPIFQQTVIPRYRDINDFKQLHKLILSNKQSMEKEEAFYLFMGNLLQHYASFSDEKDEPSQNIQQAVLYIQQHFDQPITLDFLSELMSINKYSLIRQFTHFQGVTPHQYVTAIRIGEAKKLMEHQENLSDIAMATGFSDQSHFTRAFKALIGVTPKQYMNSYIKEEID